MLYLLFTDTIST
uniref:Uncharacterized protein n=1 Tax=Arundo donax TaxID=35708 RepID=A0A0A9HEW4_ARUDO